MFRFFKKDKLDSYEDRVRYTVMSADYDWANCSFNTVDAAVTQALAQSNCNKWQVLFVSKTFAAPPIPILYMVWNGRLFDVTLTEVTVPKPFLIKK